MHLVDRQTAGELVSKFLFQIPAGTGSQLKGLTCFHTSNTRVKVQSQTFKGHVDAQVPSQYQLGNRHRIKNHIAGVSADEIERSRLKKKKKKPKRTGRSEETTVLQSACIQEMKKVQREIR